MDYATLAKILNDTAQENEQTSPYRPLIGTFDAIGDASLQIGAKSGDYKTGIIGSLVSGLLGGATQGINNNYVAGKNQQAADILWRSIQGQNSEIPDGMAPSVFAQVNTGGELFRRQRELEQQQLDQRVEAQLAAKGLIKDETSGQYRAAPGMLEANNQLEGLTDQTSNALAKLNLGEELSADEATALSRSPLGLQRLANSLEQTNAVSDRFNQKFDFTKSERALPGYTNITGATPTSTQVNKLREVIRSNDEVKNALKALKETGDQDGFFKLVGSDAQMQAALRSSIFNAYRKRTGSGARLEGPEGQMIKAMTPKVLAGDPLGALSAAAMGRNQQEFADNMIKYLDEDRDLQLFSQGFKANNRELGFYPKDELDKFNLSQLLEQQTPSPVEEATGTAQYSLSDLQAAGYSQAEIQALQAQGYVK